MSVSSPAPADFSSMANVPTSPRTTPPTELPVVDSKSSLTSAWQSPMTKAMIYYQQGHKFLQEAYQNRETKQYYRLIALGIKSLLVCFKYSPSEDQPGILGEISEIYMEIGDYASAEEYANQAIQMSNTPVPQYNLSRVISSVSSHTFTMNHMQKHASGPLSQLLRTCLQLTNPATADVGSIFLEKWLTNHEPVNDEIQMYAQLVNASTLLDGAPARVLQLEFTDVDVAQLKGLKYMTKLMAAVKVANAAVIKHYVKKLNQLIGFHQSGGWHRWRQDGTFAVKVDDCTQVDVQWQSPSELIVSFYLVSALGYIATGELAKSNKALEKANTVVSKHLVRYRDGVEPVSEAQRQRIYHRLLYLEVMVVYYHTWSRFASGMFKMDELMDLLGTYEDKKCPPFQQEVITGMEKEIAFLFGVYHCGHHNWDQAEYWLRKSGTDGACLQLLVVLDICRGQDPGVTKQLEKAVKSERLGDLFKYTYALIMALMGEVDISQLEAAMKSDGVRGWPVVHKMVMLLVLDHSGNGELKHQAIAELAASTTNDEVNIIVLERLFKYYEEVGDQNKANMTKLQLKYFQEAGETKIQGGELL